MRHWKLAAKARWIALRNLWVRMFRSYGPAELGRALAAIGIAPGDTVMLHSAFGSQYGFRGTVEEFTDTVLRALGERGNLLMVSLPYRSSSLQYLQRGKVFDVRRTPSMMGLVSEHFRRRDGVQRSLHPTHPICAHGPDASRLLADHESRMHPCGDDTPFSRFAGLDGKIVFFNVPLETLTFFHHLEHLIADRLPFALYTAEPITVPVIDIAGEPRSVTTYAYPPETIRRRRFDIFANALQQRGAIHGVSVGASRIIMLRARDAIDCTLEMARASQFFYDLSPTRTPDHD